MRLSLIFVCLSCFLVPTFGQDADSTPAPIVYFDIAGPGDAALQEFYADVFGWRPSATGELAIPVTSPLAGLIRSDPAEKRIHIGVEDIAAKLAEIAARGGVIDAPRFEVPGVVVLGLFKNPGGNPMALIEMKNGTVVIS